MVSDKFKFTNEDDKALRRYGFGDYMIDFSDIPDKEVAVFLKFIKNRNKKRGWK